MKTKMKNLILIASIMTAALASAHADDFVKYSPTAQRIAARDACARIAVRSVIDQIVDAISDAGVDYPDSIEVKLIDVIERGHTYAITTDGSQTQIVQTQITGRKCTVIQQPSEITPE